MKTIEHESVVQKINHLARQVAPREGELERPLEWDEERGIWSGFLLNYDAGAVSLLSKLIGEGFKQEVYRAPYHWKVKSPVFTFPNAKEDSPFSGPHYVVLEYVEGDLYATAV